MRTQDDARREIAAGFLDLVLADMADASRDGGRTYIDFSREDLRRRRIPSTIRSNAHCYGGRVLLERGDVTNAVRHLRAAAFLGSEEATNRLEALRLRSR